MAHLNPAKTAPRWPDEKSPDGYKQEPAGFFRAIPEKSGLAA